MHAGTITVGPAGDPITLGPGDYARYSGDGPHVYRSADEDVHGMLLVGYPPALPGAPGLRWTGGGSPTPHAAVSVQAAVNPFGAPVTAAPAARPAEP